MLLSKYTEYKPRASQSRLLTSSYYDIENISHEPHKLDGFRLFMFCYQNIHNISHEPHKLDC